MTTKLFCYTTPALEALVVDQHREYNQGVWEAAALVAEKGLDAAYDYLDELYDARPGDAIEQIRGGFEDALCALDPDAE